MFSPLPTRRRSVNSTLLSVAAHAVVAGLVVLSLRMHPVQVFSLPGTDLGTRVELTYMPGRAPVPAPHPQRKVKPKAVSGPPITPVAHGGEGVAGYRPSAAVAAPYGD